MKTFILFAFFAVILSSCGVNTNLPFNLNANTTNVELSKKNFEVISTVTGESSATYILGIGGLKNRALYDMAKADMLKNANLVGGAKALVNVVTEQHITLVYPFYFKRRIIMSAHIVEFKQ